MSGAGNKALEYCNKALELAGDQCEQAKAYECMYLFLYKLNITLLVVHYSNILIKHILSKLYIYQANHSTTLTKDTNNM